MTRFRKALAERNHDPAHRSWLFVSYDQLTDQVGPLAREDPRTLGIVVVESPWKAARRPYHKQKLALIIGNLRHFALEQAERGVAVKHMVVNGPYRNAVLDAARQLGTMRMMLPAERELRDDLAAPIEQGALAIIPHEGWLTTSDDFTASHPKGGPWLLEKFYRYVRKQTGILMEQGQPAGGKYNFDAENRSPYKNGPVPATPLDYPNDPIKEEVGDLIERQYARHPGKLDLQRLPVTRKDAEDHWEWAKAHCLPIFGKYEDAMYTQSSTLFHTRISALMNIHRLLPARIVAEADQLDIPIASKEGFIRQVLGWREFMRHVHEATDGFRRLPDGETGPDGGAVVSALGAENPLPPAYWGKRSGLNCLDQVVAGVWSEGWSHHITRLMILSNFATLIDTSPRELTDWFWVAYIDAYDWVVEPNVLGLGTFAVGALFTTKPYVSGANYIHRMSDYCESCRFDPRKNCPYTPLYWAFLERHRDVLQSNHRMRVLYRSLDSRPPAVRKANHELFEIVRDTLRQGKVVTPERLGI